VGDDSFPNSLVEGPVYLFRDWPNPAVPKVAAGVYTIWRESELIYAGMSGRGLTREAIASHREAGSKPIGLYTRLSSHWAGRRSGDQFCVYVADRLVLQTLTRGKIEEIAADGLSMDALVRTYIHDYLSYRFAEAPDGEGALRWEKFLCSGAWNGQRPLLNPRSVRK
jgi:hypothetical protein